MATSTSNLTPEQKDYEKRVEALQEEMKLLLQKYRIEITAELRYATHQMIPVVVLIDVKDQYEQKKD